MIVHGRLSSKGVIIDQDPFTSAFNCCQSKRSIIPYEDLLDIEERQIGHFVLKYVNRSSKPYKLSIIVVRIRNKSFVGSNSSEVSLANSNLEDELVPESVVGIIRDRSYSGCKNPAERLPILVIINPRSGPGKALDLYNKRAAPIFAAAGLATSVVVTEYPGHARDIVRAISLEEYDTIVCVSGDGLPHEVLNGLATRETDSTQALQHFGLAQLPGGSGNAMCLSLNNGENDWAALALGIVKGLAEPVDIMGISQGHEYFYSFLSQSFGIVADCDLGTEDFRWMGGARFTVGIVIKCLAGNQYPCEIAYEEIDTGPGASASEDQTETERTEMDSHSHLKTATITPSTTSLQLQNSAIAAAPPSSRLKINDPLPSTWKKETRNDLSMFYVGKMTWMSGDAQVFPHSEPLDGAMDMIIWDNSFGSIRALTALSQFEKGTHVPMIPFYRKVRAYRLTPLVNDQYLSIDGESYPCMPFQVEVLPGFAKFVTPVKYVI